MILRAGVLYDGTLELPRPNADVEIADGKIVAIRDAGGEFDREAACIAPGLVNALKRSKTVFKAGNVV